MPWDALPPCLPALLQPALLLQVLAEHRARAQLGNPLPATQRSAACLATCRAALPSVSPGMTQCNAAPLTAIVAIPNAPHCRSAGFSTVPQHGMARRLAGLRECIAYRPLSSLASSDACVSHWRQALPGTLHACAQIVFARTTSFDASAQARAARRKAGWLPPPLRSKTRSVTVLLCNVARSIRYTEVLGSNRE